MEILRRFFKKEEKDTSAEERGGWDLIWVDPLPTDHVYEPVTLENIGGAIAVMGIMGRLRAGDPVYIPSQRAIILARRDYELQ